MDGVFLLAVGLTALLYCLYRIHYNLHCHPLASVPGPFWARCSLVCPSLIKSIILADEVKLWRVAKTSSGRFHRAIDDAHKKYGDVVRVSPNELSFATVDSWNTIYGHAVAGKPTMVKGEFYEMYGSGFDSLCIGSERDPRVHSRMRKSLSSAFSTKALYEQEAIVRGCIDGFVSAIAQHGTTDKGINMTKWFEMIAFDILGEMAFGESFGCIKSAKPHFWSEMIVEHLYFITVLDNLRRFPWVAAIGRRVLPSLTVGVRDKHSGFSRQKVAQRLENGSSRQDFMASLIARVKSGEIEKEEMTAHASTLVIAGGETVATFLAAVTFHLIKTPDVIQKLQTEIRSVFKSNADVDARKALSIPYLRAVIAEGLRIYPPGSQGFPRTCPGAIISDVHVPPGTEVYTSAWTLTHDERNFKDPFSFRPERWLDEKNLDIKEASQPFSLGPRGCLGKNFAMMEMALIMAKLHVCFDMELVDPAQMWEEASSIHIMWWKPKLPVRFHPRAGSTA